MNFVCDRVSVREREEWQNATPADSCPVAEPKGRILLESGLSLHPSLAVVRTMQSTGRLKSQPQQRFCNETRRAWLIYWT